MSDEEKAIYSGRENSGGDGHYESPKQICKEYGISDSLAYRWRDEALEAIKGGFSDKRKQRHQTPDAEKERLLKLIGQQAVIIDYQKKISQELCL